MTPNEFREKWTGHELKERSACQEHFIDLCRMLGHPTPAEADPKGESFCFEYGVEKLSGEKGFADVWKRGFFGWEYKGLHANLERAYEQLLQYREALQNPPLLVVCDTDVIIVHTNFVNTVKQAYTVALAGIEEPANLEILRNVFKQPDRLRPDETPEDVTEEAAARVAALADRMRARGVPARDAAHFLMRLIFCLFAEDIGLLHRGLMTEILTETSDDPAAFDEVVARLFGAMATGGRVLLKKIEHFDGGLFADDLTVPLEREEIAMLADVAGLDWSGIEPAIFGTLFERSLDPNRRAQLGAHYTSRGDINDIIEPVLMAPLREEWAEVREGCDALAAEVAAAKTRATRTRRQKKLQAEVEGFIERLASVRVLDPACGSGNFLYVALSALNDLEKEVVQATGPWRVQVPFRKVDPSQLYGIEIDPYAVELAQLTVWIGYLQWMHFNGYLGSERPILKPLDNIREMDAILGTDGAGDPVEPEWPEADVIVGNPPFLGVQKLRGELGDEYVERLFATYAGSVPNEADLCCYWFERARKEIASGHARRAGLLATNSIRQPYSRPVIQRIGETGGVFMAWSDRAWVLDGAAVRISMVGFDDGTQAAKELDGGRVAAIHADLTGATNVAGARALKAAVGIAFQGDMKGGAFDVPGELAAALLCAANPLGRDNRDVVRPWRNATDIVRRSRDMWIIDFGAEMPEREAALYEAPFEYVREHVWPVRRRNRRKTRRERWWIHADPQPAMRRAISVLSRYIATPRVAKFRVFVWLHTGILPSNKLMVFAREDDYLLGILHSRVHETWSLAQCSWQGKGNDPVYTERCLLTFPFPRGGHDQRHAIAEAAKQLDEVRQSALDADPELTLTALYNKRPTWLDNLHRDLDEAVSAAYGWPADIGEDDLLERLLTLNLERAEEEERGLITPP